jgi:hypothetical protein
MADTSPAMTKHHRSQARLPAPSVVHSAKIACIEPGRIDRRVSGATRRLS